MGELCIGSVFTPATSNVGQASSRWVPGAARAHLVAFISLSIAATLPVRELSAAHSYQLKYELSGMRRWVGRREEGGRWEGNNAVASAIQQSTGINFTWRSGRYWRNLFVDIMSRIHKFLLAILNPLTNAIKNKTGTYLALILFLINFKFLSSDTVVAEREQLLPVFISTIVHTRYR